MIVLDEHLQGLGIEDAVGKWYRGRVVTVTSLRPGAVVKDDLVPALLRTLLHPTFVTLNWPHFWRRTVADKAFCVVGFALPTDHALEVSGLLRRLLTLPQFKTKAARAGKVARVSGHQVAYYHPHNAHVYLLPLSTG